jgi:hypothetical protein
MGYLNTQDVKNAIRDLGALEKLSYTTLSCPMMVEVIAEK